MRTLPLSLVLAVGVAWLHSAHDAGAGVQRTQTITLRAGWNAVYLEVQPAAARPDEVFAGLPVDTVACFVPARADAEYLRQPGDAPWREEGWAIWYAPGRPDAFLSNLHEVQVRRGLLVHATAEATWTVTGEARATVLEWYPNTCTLTGLPVDPERPPTFAQFFAGSPAHRRLRVFRLEAGNWRLVREPATERVRSGEAYWIQTDGTSRYQGPLRVEFPAVGELDFDRRVGSRELGFVNEAPGTPVRVAVELVPGPDGLPLRILRKELASLSTATAAWETALNLPALAAGQRQTLRIAPHRDAMTGELASALLRITDGRGTQLWLPVRARRDPGTTPVAQR